MTLALDYFVTGATARDISLGGVFGLDHGWGTKDVDLAIALDGWPPFDVITTNLPKPARLLLTNE